MRENYFQILNDPVKTTGPIGHEEGYTNFIKGYNNVSSWIN